MRPGSTSPRALAARLGPTPLRHVTDIQLPGSDTVGGPVGQLGARDRHGRVSADGRVVALRTYTDAWLFAVPDGDLGGSDALPQARCGAPAGRAAGRGDSPSPAP